MCQNIEDFNRGAALILAALYASFPRRSTLYAEQIEPDPGEATPGMKDTVATLVRVALGG